MTEYLGLAMGGIGISIAIFSLWLNLFDKFISSPGFINFLSLILSNISFWLFFLFGIIYLILYNKEYKKNPN